MKKNLVIDLFNTTNSKGNNISNLNEDELTQLVNRLSESFKKYISRVKSSISQTKEIFSFIAKNIHYAQSIINDIINYNYSFEQLNVLEESIKQIKEKNKNNNLNLYNYEQNLNIFIEETNVLFKTINQKYKLKLKEWSIYLSIPTSIKTKNDSIKKISINKNEFNEWNNNKMNYKLNDSSRNKNEKKRTKSSENKNQIMEDMDKRNIKYSKSQKIYKSKISKTTKSSKNKNKYDEKGINLINLNLPFNKSHSIYNIDIRNEVLFDKCCRNESILNQNNKQKNYILQNKNFKIIKDSKNIDYEKQIQELNEEISYYKNLVNDLSKNKNNLNVNISNNDNKILLDKLRLKETEILSKDKKIKLMNQEIIKCKNLINKMNSEKIQSEIGVKMNSFRNTNNNFNLKDYPRYKTESNLTNSVKFNSNYNNNDNISKNIENMNQNYYKNYINKINFLEKENNIFKHKLNELNDEFSQRTKNIEKENILVKKEIIELRKQVKTEVNKKEELNKLYQEQKIKYECELSKICDKRTELSKFLSNKNSEITNLQQEIMRKDKELENYKKLINKKEFKSINEENDKLMKYYSNIIKEKETKELKLNNEINILKEQISIISTQNEKRKKEIIELNNKIKELELELSKKNKEIDSISKEIKKGLIINNKKTADSNELELTIKKLKDENDGLKEFTLKQQKILMDNEQKDEKISMLQKEKETLKQYFIDLNMPIPSSQLNDSNHKHSKKKNKTFESKFNEEDCFNILMQLNEAKKEIASLKKKNEELFNDLDSKKLKREDYLNHISEDNPLSNYEEEFDLKKMAKGVKEKNRSQDINIDYPGIQHIKEKYRELYFYYNSLEELIKKLLLCSTCTNKNRAYIVELCKIVGFDEEVTNKILNNKIKKGILNMFG